VKHTYPIEPIENFARNPAQWQGELLRTWRGIRRGTRHGNERLVFVYRKFLNETDCVEEPLPAIELELDKPPLAPLLPIVIFREQVRDVVWHAA